jgi:NAD(P)-dependent dehydrogenase (short-subunit alcohol dehydrogenase family)
LRKYVEDLAPFLADSGVYINSLDPGWLRTDMGGPDAPNRVGSVLPGALLPVLLKHPVSGYEFQAQDYACLTLERAISTAEEKIAVFSDT